LRSSLLDESGLLPALREYTEGLSTEGDIKVQLVIDDDFERLSSQRTGTNKASPSKKKTTPPSRCNLPKRKEGLTYMERIVSVAIRTPFFTIMINKLETMKTTCLQKVRK